MANTTSGGYENNISLYVQKGLQVSPIFQKLASFREESRLQNGVQVNRPKVSSSYGKGATYVANTDITATPWTYTQELLTINRTNAHLIEVDVTEEKALMVATENMPERYFARDMIAAMKDALDKDYLDEIANAGYDIDASDFGGSASVGIDPASTPVEEIISKAISEIAASRKNNKKGQYVIIDNYLLHYLRMRGLALGFNAADKIMMGGWTGADIMGANIVLSENIPWTLVLTMSDVAVADNTFTIAGVTCTAKATPASAGEFDVEASATAQGATIAALINGSGTPGADTYIELSGADRDKWDSHGLSASNDSGVVTITGYGRVTFSETLTNGSFGNLTMKYKAGNIGDVDMVAQLNPYVKTAEQVKNFGKVLKGMTLWGTKTFADGVDNGCSILIKG